MIAMFKHPEMYVGHGVWRIVGTTVRKDKIMFANFLYGPDEIEITTLYFDKECLDFARPEELYMTKAEAVEALRNRCQLCYEASKIRLAQLEQDMRFVDNYCKRNRLKENERVQLSGVQEIS